MKCDDRIKEKSPIGIQLHKRGRRDGDWLGGVIITAIVVALAGLALWCRYGS